MPKQYIPQLLTGGPRGYQGLTGLQGPKGSTGQTGPSGTAFSHGDSYQVQYTSDKDEVATATITAASHGDVHGLSAGQKITLTSTDGTVVDYFVSDTVTGLAHKASVVNNSILSMTGPPGPTGPTGPVVAALSSNATGIAVGFDLSGQTTQNDFLLLLIDAIQDPTCLHSTRILVALVTNGVVDLTQVTPGIAGNTDIVEDLATFSDTNFTGGAGPVSGGTGTDTYLLDSSSDFQFTPSTANNPAVQFNPSGTPSGTINLSEFKLTNINGSGYARHRENHAGFPYQGGWPNSGTTAGSNTVFKIHGWVDYGGLAAVNLFTLPNVSPWPQIADNPNADGRGLIGMNLRSTYNYFLKRYAQGDLYMQDHQVRQKSALFHDQTETWADTNISQKGDIGFVEISTKSDNQSFVYHGNNDVITMKNPMSLSFSARYAYGTHSGTVLWTSTQGSGGSLSATNPTGSTLGQFRFIKPGSGAGPNQGSVSWASDTVMSPGSGCLPKIATDGSGMLHSRNNIPQSGWIVGFIVMEGGNSTTFEAYQSNNPNATSGTPGNYGSLVFDIVTGNFASGTGLSTSIASDIHTHNINGGSRTQRTMKTFREAIRYDNITTGLGIRFKVTVADPNQPGLWNFVSIKGNTLLIELLVIEDVVL
tara:strand:- start:725 stop:2665 length:1941 start_codon:yes stop_codon:yes gene_type:complete